MPICRPEAGPLPGTAEHRVWEQLREQLPVGAYLLSHIRLSNDLESNEMDLIVAWPGVGICLIEVKGGYVKAWQQPWVTNDGHVDHEIDPYHQLANFRAAMTRHVKPRWNHKLRPEVAMLIALADTDIPTGREVVGVSRQIVVDRSELPMISDRIRGLCDQQSRKYSTAECEEFVNALMGEWDAQRHWAREADAHKRLIDSITEQQAPVLDLLSEQSSFVIKGPAGSGKTYLALEQTRQLAKQGKSVALLCYSRGLARLLQRVITKWPPNERPEFVGSFEQLGVKLGVKSPESASEDWWSSELPDGMTKAIAHDDRSPKSEIRRYDAFVVDEAQDFYQSWWDVLTLLTKNSVVGFPGYLFGDPSQMIFPRNGYRSLGLPEFPLRKNLRNARPIAELAGLLFDNACESVGLAGQPVRYVAASSDEAIVRADDIVGMLIDEEDWGVGDIALLTTYGRHPEQQNQLDSRGDDGYWDGLWNGEDIFYSTVAKFKGLERPVVIITLNGFRHDELARENLYVGMSRARELLIVVGDLAEVRKAKKDRLVALLEANRWDPQLPE